MRIHQENSILSFFMHEISHNMKNVHKFIENICKKNFYFTKIHLKYVGSIMNKAEENGMHCAVNMLR